MAAENRSLWTGTNYELATRAVIFDGAGVFNANLYFGDWREQLVDVAEIPGSVAFFRIENAGESEIFGIELDFNYRVSDALTIFATAAYSETEYVDFISTTGEDFSGNRFTFAPEATGAIGANYRLNSGWYVNVNATYRGGSYADRENTTKLESRTLLNVHTGYEFQHWELEAYTTNIFDEQYATNVFGIVNEDNGQRTTARLGAPREYGLRVTASF